MIPPWLDSDPVLDFWAAASELGLPVTVILYRLNNASGGRALAHIARQFRNLPILVDHVGLPHPSTPEKKWGEAHGHDYSIPAVPDFGVAEHLGELGALPHVFFKVTDINFDRLEEAHLDAARLVRVLADAFGAERLLWGSDVGQSPAPYAEKVARLHHSARLLNDAERAAFFGATAMRLYGAALGKTLTMAATALQGPLVDSHAHIWEPDMPYAATALDASELRLHGRAVSGRHGKCRRQVRRGRRGQPVRNLQRLHHTVAAQVSQSARHCDPRSRRRSGCTGCAARGWHCGRAPAVVHARSTA